jgi:hypothetical protein
MFIFIAEPHNKIQIPTIYPTKQLDQTGQGQHTSTEIKAIPLHAWRGPLFSKAGKLPEFLDICHTKVVSLSALRTGLLYRQGDMPGTHFCYRLNRPQGHKFTGRIKSTILPEIETSTFGLLA